MNSLCEEPNYAIKVHFDKRIIKSHLKAFSSREQIVFSLLAQEFAALKMCPLSRLGYFQKCRPWCRHAVEIQRVDRRVFAAAQSASEKAHITARSALLYELFFSDNNAIALFERGMIHCRFFGAEQISNALLSRLFFKRSSTANWCRCTFCWAEGEETWRFQR